MKNSTLHNQIYVTNDYSQFSLLKENRKLNQRNYAKLVVSMREELLEIPILVNEKMEIVDGQHRFFCCQELNLPVFYFIVNGYGIDEVRKANMVSSNWVKDDFLNMHLENGIESYVCFKDLIDQYEVNITDLLKLFAIVQDKNQNIMAKCFEEGTFVTDGFERVVDFLNALDDFDFFRPYKTKQFVGAFIKLFFHPEYDHSKMLERLRVRKHAFTNKSTTDDYLLMLTKDVYSFGAVKKPLFYDAETKRFYS